jgi:superfamily I DNA/RNA helicase
MVTSQTWGKFLMGLESGGVARATTLPFHALLEEIDELIEADVSLGSYLNQLNPLGKDIALNQDTGVRIMTMTRSKGLTVRATIVVGVEDAIIPHEGADPSEERRLLYVAMTRSTEFLYCTWARRRRGRTARSGSGRVQERRGVCRFLRDGPVRSQDGDSYVAKRWPL